MTLTFLFHLYVLFSSFIISFQINSWKEALGYIHEEIRNIPRYTTQAAGVVAIPLVHKTEKNIQWQTGTSGLYRQIFSEVVCFHTTSSQETLTTISLLYQTHVENLQIIPRKESRKN